MLQRLARKTWPSGFRSDGWKGSGVRGVYTDMSRRRSSALKATSALIDAVMDGYVSWREASAAAEAAYHRWRQAPRDERGEAFAGYVAALDREECAAAEYRRLIELAEAA